MGITPIFRRAAFRRAEGGMKMCRIAKIGRSLVAMRVSPLVAEPGIR
jgi:hypothetical protein